MQEDELPVSEKVEWIAGQPGLDLFHGLIELAPSLCQLGRRQIELAVSLEHLIHCGKLGIA
jgi:hypothetical protein